MSNAAAAPETRLRRHIQMLFDVPVSLCVATPAMYGERLWAQEVDTVKGAVAKRKREYAAGRAAARAALRELGVPPGPILTQPDRAPEWPRQFVGSISHCDSCCVAVVARRGRTVGVGIDVEQATRLPEEILRTVCSADEINRFGTPPLLNSDWGKLAFCAKEAFYKCYYPLTKTFLDFSDVSVLFSAEAQCESGNFSAVITSPDKPKLSEGFVIVGRWCVAEGYVLAGVTARVDSRRVC